VGGYAPDINDCPADLSEKEAIRKKDLPDMLKNVQREAGLLIGLQV